MQNIRPCGSGSLPPAVKARRAACGAEAKRVALVAIALVCLALSFRAAAEERERIPGGCRELADRAGLPLTLTHAEAVRAIAYLSLMSGRDPAVVRCRAAMLRR